MSLCETGEAQARCDERRPRRPASTDRVCLSVGLGAVWRAIDQCSEEPRETSARVAFQRLSRDRPRPYLACSTHIFDTRIPSPIPAESDDSRRRGDGEWTAAVASGRPGLFEAGASFADSFEAKLYEDYLSDLGVAQLTARARWTTAKALSVHRQVSIEDSPVGVRE